MRIGRAGTAFVTTAALLLAAGGWAFCLPASHSVMPCCKQAKPCGSGMKAADCCRFVPASPARAPVGVETSNASKVSREEMQAATLAMIFPGAFSHAPVFRGTSPPPVLLRDLSIPLYLLNTSLLR